MTKPILYIDMDNVLVNFQTGIAKLDKETRLKYKGNYDEVPNIFSKMEPIKGAVEAVNQLAEYYDIYALSTAPWDNPTAWSDKIEWIQKYFGKVLYKRLILSHHKNLNKGDLLIDDRLKNGVEQFEGEHLHFGIKYKNWQEVTDYLLDKSNLDRMIKIRSKKSLSELDFIFQKYENVEKAFLSFDFDNNEERFYKDYLPEKLNSLLFKIEIDDTNLYFLINCNQHPDFTKTILKLSKLYSNKSIDLLKGRNNFYSYLSQFLLFNPFYQNIELAKRISYSKYIPSQPGDLKGKWAKSLIFLKIENKLSGI
ncbi:5'(3')-deoxyribonucleotidase [Canicola haemoglobinophilus]|uniref:5'(3')-deoxyribonucleotidase n=1 Tax=Canicola haemoglobinophilus TaxID=733 RepID=A0AB38HAP0_9PAST|nr:hypothetical protein [Canicola haemoglobinophilus]STO54089.1 5'(3')-deoxyribonucleotidase [Canicola haemoglobinophilus]STO68622.1 5'(3')-deoxyribonucleotidase [Canicola haemoglobinophilus]